MADDSPPTTTIETCTIPLKMSHKKWKAYLRKMKRKAMRTAEAKKRDLEGGVDENNSVTDSEEERQRAREEAESVRQHAQWLERERQAQLAFQAKKEWEEKEKRRKEETERKIREEWEEREKKEREEQEEKDKQEQEKRDKQDKLLKEATANENTEAWHNPIAPVQYRQPSQERQVDSCPFFKKTATCRFGDQCSRFHDHPDSSCTLLMAGMFSCFELEQSVVDNQDTDISLEYDESDMYQSFKDFYDDVLPECKTVGTVLQFKVCCNYERHLRGNVYVQYSRESAALSAFHKFNARWYGGRQVTCRFVNIESWKAAICGLAFRKRCPKGKACNFLHVFRNPGNEFADMDQDRSLLNNDSRRRNNNDRSYRGRDDRSSSRRESVRSQYHNHHRGRRQSHSRSRSRSTSPSRQRSTRSRHRPSRSRSRSRGASSRRSVRNGHRRARSRSRSVTRNKTHRVGSNSPESPSKRHRSSSKSPVSPRSPTSSKAVYKTKTENRRGRSRSRSKESKSGKHRASQRMSRSRSRSRSRRSRSKSKLRLRQGGERIRSRSRSRSRLKNDDKDNCRSRSRSKSPLREEDRNRSRSRSGSDSMPIMSEAETKAPTSHHSSRRSKDERHLKSKKSSKKHKRRKREKSEGGSGSDGDEEKYEYAEVTKEMLTTK